MNDLMKLIALIQDMQSHIRIQNKNQQVIAQDMRTLDENQQLISKAIVHNNQVAKGDMDNVKQCFTDIADAFLRLEKRIQTLEMLASKDIEDTMDMPVGLKSKHGFN